MTHADLKLVAIPCHNIPHSGIIVCVKPSFSFLFINWNYIVKLNLFLNVICVKVNFILPVMASPKDHYTSLDEMGFITCNILCEVILNFKTI